MYVWINDFIFAFRHSNVRAMLMIPVYEQPIDTTENIFHYDKVPQLPLTLIHTVLIPRSPWSTWRAASGGTSCWPPPTPGSGGRARRGSPSARRSAAAALSNT